MAPMKYFIFFFIVFSLFATARTAAACEMCTVPRLGKDEGLSAVSQDKKWFFKYLFEVQNADSGGTTLLLGPSLAVELDQALSFFASVHLPVYQDPGGSIRNWIIRGQREEGCCGNLITLPA